MGNVGPARGAYWVGGWRRKMAAGDGDGLVRFCRRLPQGWVCCAQGSLSSPCSPSASRPPLSQCLRAAPPRLTGTHRWVQAFPLSPRPRGGRGGRVRATRARGGGEICILPADVRAEGTAASPGTSPLKPLRSGQSVAVTGDVSGRTPRRLHRAPCDRQGGSSGGTHYGRSRKRLGACF